MLRVLETLFYTVLVALLLAVVVLLVGTRFTLPGQYEIKIVRSGSMEPTIMTGSVVLIHPVATYQVGDIITFGADTATRIPTTHRIVATEEFNGHVQFRTKGDANEVEDREPTALKDVIGKTLFAIPYLGYVLDFARQPLGFGLLVGIPAAVIILDEIVTIIHELARRERRKRRDAALKESARAHGEELSRMSALSSRMSE